ncbi:MAG: hypothetical protein L0229_04295 [Blastocatellia bacterium]|nr:hypothetical protein [Blastocatellia bacterium]
MPLITNAQQLRSPDDKSELEMLREQLREQREKTDQLLKTVKGLSEAVDRQARLLHSLEQKLALIAGRNADLEDRSEQAKAGETVREKNEEDVKQPEIHNVEAGKGKIKFSGLIQGWYAAGNRGLRDTFRLRRTELKFTGQITPKVSWTAMIDPSRALSLNNSFVNINSTSLLSDASVNQTSRILQDAFITLGYFDGLKANVGQFKVPLSLEGLQSSSSLETVERALFLSDRARGGNYGDVRDIGVMIHGPLSEHVDYQLGLFNGGGESQNDLDRNDQKAMAARVVVRPPFLSGLQIGGSCVWGNGAGPDRPRRDRFGGEALFYRDKYRIKSEVMAGVDADIHRLGYYALFAYKVRPTIEAVYRFDSWDPDTRLESTASSVTERDHVLGINYFISENHVKFQMNYLRKTFSDNILRSRNLVLINLQTSW